MSNRVFISHSSKDFEVANRVCDFLERQGIVCWIAPRDIPPGAPEWEEELTSALESCRAVVVLLSEAASNSDHVNREVKFAIRRSKPLFPLRIEPLELRGALAYYLDDSQHVDAVPAGLEPAIEKIAAKIHELSPTKPGVPQFWDLPLVDREIERDELEHCRRLPPWPKRPSILDSRSTQTSNCSLRNHCRRSKRRHADLAELRRLYGSERSQTCPLGRY
jgi:hypothetical protein